MLQKQYTTLLNTPILHRETGEELGEVYDLIIDPDTGKVEAFWVKQGVLSGAEKVLALQDIAEWKIKVYINDEDSIVNPEEIIKIREILKKGITLPFLQVKTSSGIKLGKVTDIFFETITGQMLQIQVMKSFFGIKYAKRLISFENIYEINKNAVVLNDDYNYISAKEKSVLDLTDAVSN